MVSLLTRIRRQRVIVFLIILTLIIFVYLLTIPVNQQGQNVDPNQALHPVIFGENGDSNEDILEIAKRIWSAGDPVLITVINDAYLPFTNSWLCNTVYMGVHKQVLIVTTDEPSRDSLKRRWADVNVGVLPGSDAISGDQTFSHAGYVRIMIHRAQVILELLKEGIEVLLFEVDCVWFANPIPECRKSVRNYDILATKVTNRTGLVGGGFLYIKPTRPAMELWMKLTERLMELEDEISSLEEDSALSHSDNDQVYLSNLIMSGYGGVKVITTSLEVFADGRWYKMKPEVRERLRPLIINNNWMSGNKAKMRRARKFRHWFWKKSKKCDLKLVKKTVYKTANHGK